jgi:hypothetical protein
MRSCHASIALAAVVSDQCCVVLRFLLDGEQPVRSLEHAAAGYEGRCAHGFLTES